MRPEVATEVQEWLERADDDLREAEHDLTAVPPLARGGATVTTSSSGPVGHQHLQTSLLAIPQTLLCYWLRQRSFELQAGRRAALGAGGCPGGRALDGIEVYPR